MMFRQSGDEAVVHGGKDRQVSGTVRGLCRLVVSLDDMRREAIQMGPVPREPLTEPQRTGRRAGPSVQPGFDNRLRQADLGGDAKSLVDRSPLGEEAAVAVRVG